MSRLPAIPNFSQLGNRSGAGATTRPPPFRPSPFSMSRFSVGLTQFQKQTNARAAARAEAGSRGTALDQLSSALERDVGAVQGAANRQFGRIEGQVGSAEDLIGGIDERLTGVAEGASARLGELGEEFNVLGERTRGDFDVFAENIQAGVAEDVDALTGSIDAATAQTREGADLLSRSIGERADVTSEQTLGFAQDAIASAKDAIFDTQTLANRQMDAAVTGLEARTRRDMQRIDAGLRADGTQMTPEEQRAARAQLRAATNQSLTQVTSQLFAQAQTLFAQLKTNLAQTQVQAGQLALGAGAQQLQAGQLQAGLEELKSTTEARAASEKAGLVGLKAEVGVQLGQQKLAAEQIAQGFQQMRGDLAKLASTLITSAKSAAIGFEVQGRFAIAQLVRDNPETVVGMFSGIAAMLAASSAPGARGIPAFNFGGR